MSYNIQDYAFHRKSFIIFQNYKKLQNFTVNMNIVKQSVLSLLILITLLKIKIEKVFNLCTHDSVQNVPEKVFKIRSKATFSC